MSIFNAEAILEVIKATRRWVKEEFKRKRQNEWSNSENTMVATKPDV
jgi:hypothetical protein